MSDVMKMDHTDATDPKFQLGKDFGVDAVVKIVSGILDGDAPGKYDAPSLTALAERAARMNQEAEIRGLLAAAQMMQKSMDDLRILHGFSAEREPLSALITHVEGDIIPAVRAAAKARTT